MDLATNESNLTILSGDICVIYISEHLKQIFKVEPGTQCQTKFGSFLADDLIGQRWGVKYNCRKGWIIPLRLTPELWTQLLPHRTQILYQADISMILIQLDIKPGSIVVESGTGSGSLSHSILRACRPSGTLFTFDIDQTRVTEAEKEFKEHGFSGNVKVRHRNVCEEGFGEELIGKVDACMLDIPRTWDAIEHAYKILKPGGSRLCTFSPCIEQVQQNVNKMIELKMKDIVTLETLLRPYDIKVQQLQVWSDEVLEGLTLIEQERFKNLSQGCSSSPKNDAKKPKVDQSSDEKPLSRALRDPKAPFHPTMLPTRSIVHARQPNESVSHSGYLTFASKRY